ncbi:MAG: BamA/TamA family outer membrane protein [Campylobacterales bacterium]|nr:BamA/TamA family outer membrane protein [Campylobacterales bacterium]
MRFLLSLILLLSLLFAEEDALDETKLLQIEGNKYIKTAAIEEALDVQKSSFFFFWREKEPKINIKLIPSIRESLRSFLNSQGFYNADFEIKETEKSVKVIMDENEPFKIESINIASDYDLSKIIKLKKGQIFKAKDFIDVKNTVIEALLDEGYCSYDYDNKAYVNLERRNVDLVYLLKKGDICSFEDAYIEGLETIEKDVVLSRITARKDERFSTKKVRATYDRINELDVFDSVVVDVNRKLFNKVPLDIKVSETTKPYYFKGGVGYDSYSGAQAQAQLVKRNFFGNAQKLTLTTSYSKFEQLAEIEFLKPAFFHFDKYYFDLGFKGGYSNFEYLGFQEEKSYAKVYLSYLYKRTEAIGGLRLENTKISYIDNYDASHAPIYPLQEGTFALIYPYLRFIYDTRDDKLDPKFGYYLSAYVEYGLPYKADASNYLKTLFEARGIYTINDVTLSVVGKLGSIDDIKNGVPESKLFFAGGSFSNRAYGFSELGVITSPSGYTVDGAYSFANLSVEVNFPLYASWRGALFTDNTMLSRKKRDFNGEIITAIGFGVRYVTPIGPLKVDVALNADDPSQQGFQFQIGQSF